MPDCQHMCPTCGGGRDRHGCSSADGACARLILHEPAKSHLLLAPLFCTPAFLPAPPTQDSGGGEEQDSTSVGLCAAVDKAHARNDTTLIFAELQGFDVMVEALVAGAHIDKADTDSICNTARGSGAGAAGVDRAGHYGNTALHHAALGAKRRRCGRCWRPAPTRSPTHRLCRCSCW